MTIIKSSGAGDPVSTGFYSHTIDQSLRFTSGDSAYLSRTPASAGNRDVNTTSFWVKRANLGSNQAIFSAGSSFPSNHNNSTVIQFRSNDTLRYRSESGGSAVAQLDTTRVFRDVSSWYHIVLTYESTNSTSTDRIKLYVNGVRETAFNVETYPNSGVDNFFASDSVHQIGRSTANYIDCYLAEVNFLDGLAYDPSYFGETKDGVWIAKQYSGSYGANGFHLDFSTSSFTDNGSDPDVFADQAGSNDFDAYSLAASDIVLDSPTNNWSVMNSIYHYAAGAGFTFSEGNLKGRGNSGGFNSSANGYNGVSTFAIPKDKKIYIEVECPAQDGANFTAGFASVSGLESGPSTTNVGGSNSITVYNRQVYINGNEHDYGGPGLGNLGVQKLAAGDILGCMCDGATGKVWFSRNGVYFQSPSGSTGDPTGGNHEIGTITNGATEDIFFVAMAGNTTEIFVNFGQDSVNVASAQSDENGIGTFEYAPPTDYVALCSSNLSDPTIGAGQDTQADDHFETVLFTGNGGSNDVSSLSFQPDVTIIGPRNYTGAQNYQLYDSLRSGQRMRIDSTSGQNSGTGFSFTSDGFDIGADGLSNANTYLYCSWNFKAGGTANTFNIDGTGYASMSAAPISDGTLALASLTANTIAGFSIATFNMPDAEKTVAHGLGVKPEMIIIRKYDASNHWMVWFKEMGENTSTGLRLNDGSSAATSFGGAGNWFQSVSSTLVGLGSYGSYFGLGNQIMYSFASKEGYSKIGSYEGNASADGTFVFLGFRPAFILLRNFDAANFWFTYDNRREGFNESNDTLSWNYSSVEDSTYKLDILSNGFKIRSSQNAHNQANTFVYMAIAEQSFKFANAR